MKEAKSDAFSHVFASATPISDSRPHTLKAPIDLKWHRESAGKTVQLQTRDDFSKNSAEHRATI